MPVLLRPTAPIAPDALLPGDPARALALAQHLLAEPRMCNHAHGLWGYYGATAGGSPLTVQATGVGGPSGAIVLADLAQLGVRRAVRIGPCVSLEPELRVGSMLVAQRALAGDGTSASLGDGRWREPDDRLAAALTRVGGPALRAVAVASADLVWDPGGDRRTWRRDEWLGAGAAAADMQTAALFALGARLGVEVAALLVVADEDGAPAGEGSDAELAAGVARAGELAALALASS